MELPTDLIVRLSDAMLAVQEPLPLHLSSGIEDVKELCQDLPPLSEATAEYVGQLEEIVTRISDDKTHVFYRMFATLLGYSPQHFV